MGEKVFLLRIFLRRGVYITDDFCRNGLFVRPFVRSSVRSLTPISHDREEVFRCGFLRWDGYSIGTNYTKNHLGGVKFFGTFLEIYNKPFPKKR